MKVKRDEVKNFSTAGNYFQLKDDGDSALVSFLFDKEEDVDNFIRSVHVLEKDNRSVDVDCIRTPEDPIENCPFCQEKIRLQVRFYIPLWDMDKEKVVWWTRSRGFIEKVIKQITYNIVLKTVRSRYRRGKTHERGKIRLLYYSQVKRAKYCAWIVRPIKEDTRKRTRRYGEGG